MTGETVAVLFVWALLAIGFALLIRGYRNWARHVDHALAHVEELSVEGIMDAEMLAADRVSGWIPAVRKNERRGPGRPSNLLLVGIDSEDRTMKIVDLKNEIQLSIASEKVRAYRYPMRYFMLVGLGRDTAFQRLNRDGSNSSLVVKLEDLNRLLGFLEKPPVHHRGFFGSSHRLG